MFTLCLVIAIETDRAVLVTKMVAVAGSRQRQKKAAKNKEPLPMDTEEVPPISHPSHSNVCGRVCVSYDVVIC